MSSMVGCSILPPALHDTCVVHYPEMKYEYERGYVTFVEMRKGDINMIELY